MRIYVAARFTQYERARALMDALTAAGHTITHDWTRTDEFGDDGHPKFDPNGESSLSASAIASHAQMDLDGCALAEAIVVVADEPLCGALIEMGYALALGVPVYICAPWRWTIFWGHPLVTVLPDEAAARAMFGAEVPA